MKDQYFTVQKVTETQCINLNIIAEVKHRKRNTLSVNRKGGDIIW